VPKLARMRVWPASALAVGLLVVTSCTVTLGNSRGPGVEATRSKQNESGNIIDANNNTPEDTTNDTTVDTTPIPVQEGIIDFGSTKETKSYDGYLTAAFADIEAYWNEQFPALYGEAFTPLAGHVYAAYPDRAEPIPGCGTPQTTYLDVQGNAFYCVDGDFMAYDDAELMPQLVEQLGQSAIAIVLAHEYGHAVQVRADETNQQTILKEQQADCFAGAWAAHVARGESDAINFTDADVSGGLIAMIQVRDPLQFGGAPIDESSHGTGFDRVGAFQDGFLGGAERCKTFFTENRENQLINIPFNANDPDGNLPLVDPNPDATDGPADVVTLLPADLDRYWTAQLTTNNLTLTAPTVTLFSSDGDLPSCDAVDSSELVDNVFYCTASNTIFIDQDWAETSIADPLLGDMSIGYLISQGYSEIVQTLLGSTLTGEPRALLDDCLTGSWIRDDLPPQVEGRPLYLSAGDLDEAIVTAIVRGDSTSDTNVNGSALEKVDAFRSGVLGGMESCQARITP
jgi:predicted metalloprotease